MGEGMNAVNGIILIMVGVFGLYMLWAANSPLFKRTAATSDSRIIPTHNPPGRTGDADSGVPIHAPEGVNTDPTPNTEGPTEEMYTE